MKSKAAWATGLLWELFNTEYPVDLLPLHGIETGHSFHNLITILNEYLGLNVSVIIITLSTRLFVNSEGGDVSKTSLTIVQFGREFLYIVKTVLYQNKR